MFPNFPVLSLFFPVERAPVPNWLKKNCAVEGDIEYFDNEEILLNKATIEIEQRFFRDESLIVALYYTTRYTVIY
jgi:hypothetical protein